MGLRQDSTVIQFEQLQKIVLKHYHLAIGHKNKETLDSNFTSQEALNFLDQLSNQALPELGS